MAYRTLKQFVENWWLGYINQRRVIFWNCSVAGCFLAIYSMISQYNKWSGWEVSVRSDILGESSIGGFLAFLGQKLEGVGGTAAGC